MKTTDLREAAQQALEALSLALSDVEWRINSPTQRVIHKEYNALRAALAQQAEPKGGGNLPPPLQAEPVAWYSVDQPLNYMTRCADGTEFINTVVMPAHAVSWAYTTPPQRKPLSLIDLQEALVLTNLIDRDAIDDSEEYDEGSTLAQIDELYRIIKE